jgi:hypothetical protein
MALDSILCQVLDREQEQSLRDLLRTHRANVLKNQLSGGIHVNLNTGRLTMVLTSFSEVVYG